MAGDWIKMRVWLARDPRVIRMADYLATQRPFMNWLTDPVRQSCKDSAYEHVTRNVTVALCVTGLLVTWGTAREQGDRVGDDLVLQHCDKYTFDAITDIECFGEAMEFVGWLVENENGSVAFPKFFKDNESPDEKHKRQNADRQARFRQKSQEESNAKVTEVSNVTVTPREEKRREDIKEETKTTAPAVPRFSAHEYLVSKGVSGSVAEDWLSLRKQKRAPATKTAIVAVENEASSARMALQDVLTLCCQRGWLGFKADWIAEKHSAQKTVSQKRAETVAFLTGKTPQSLQPAPVVPFVAGNIFEGEVRNVG